VRDYLVTKKQFINLTNFPMKKVTKKVSYETPDGVIKMVMAFDKNENGLTAGICPSNRTKYGERYTLRIGIGKSSRATKYKGGLTLHSFVGIGTNTQLETINKLMETKTGYVFYPLPGHEEYGLMDPITNEKSFTIPYSAKTMVLEMLEEYAEIGMMLFYTTIGNPYTEYLTKTYE
jgi:hypothetical protein